MIRRERFRRFGAISHGPGTIMRCFHLVMVVVVMVVVRVLLLLLLLLVQRRQVRGRRGGCGRRVKQGFCFVVSSVSSSVSSSSSSSSSSIRIRRLHPERHCWSRLSLRLPLLLKPTQGRSSFSFPVRMGGTGTCCGGGWAGQSRKGRHTTTTWPPTTRRDPPE